MDQKKNSYEKIYDIVKQIPRGNVATYGQVAALAGNRRWARVVGYALHVNPDPEHIPCHRVVNREGRLSDAFAFGGVNRQKLLLEAEGVTVVGNFVDLEIYQWKKTVL
ncbi:MAG: MGMT family protein [Roseburia sp.]|nr:MGMT family protein [Roseburia sp.]